MKQINKQYLKTKEIIGKSKVRACPVWIGPFVFIRLQDKRPFAGETHHGQTISGPFNLLGKGVAEELKGFMGKYEVKYVENIY